MIMRRRRYGAYWKPKTAATSKYNSQKTGGFDSKKEKRRYDELLLMERAGKIADLRRQVPFELIPAQREPARRGPRGGMIQGKLIERACSYVADFVYTDVDTDMMVVEDVKGYRDGQAYAVFAIKRKLMLWKYGIRIKET